MQYAFIFLPHNFTGLMALGLRSHLIPLVPGLVFALTTTARLWLTFFTKILQTSFLLHDHGYVNILKYYVNFASKGWWSLENKKTKLCRVNACDPVNVSSKLNERILLLK